MSTIKEAKKQAAEIIKSALDKRVEELKNTDAFKALKREIENFQDNGNYDNLSLGGSGELVMSQMLRIDNELFRGDVDTDVVAALLSSCSDIVSFSEKYCSPARGYVEYVMEQCLGDLVIYNDSPDRHQYAIHSVALKLKVSKVINEEHGYLLIEQAMRKHGYYPDVVSADYHGNVSLLSIPKDVRNATDAELVARIDAIENEKDEE